MRHFPTNFDNGAYLDVFRQPSPLSLSLRNIKKKEVRLNFFLFLLYHPYSTIFHP